MAEIRLFGVDDIPFAVAQTAREGWNSSDQAFHRCLNHDPTGCFVVEISGQLAGMVTTTCYEQSAWIGNLIVEPEHRYGGIGTLLMNHAMSYLCERGIKTIRLEADPPGVKLYRRLGFHDEFESLRFTGDSPAGNTDACEASDREHWTTVALYDAEHFGDNRGRLLSLMFEDAATIYCSHVDGKLHGYAVVMPAATSMRIGPMVADDGQMARALLERVLTANPSKSLAVGVPAVNVDAVRIVDELGWRSTPSSFRMVWGEQKGSSCAKRVFAIANGAMG